MKRRIVYTALAVVLALAQTACWSFQFGAKGFPLRDVEAPLAKGAILRVNEAGIAWGNGGLGPSVQKGLLRAGLFERVYYPIEPANPSDLVVEVDALGKMHEIAIWGFIAAAATGYFFFMPAPVMPYFEDYGVTCDVRVRRGHEVLREFQVETQSNVVHAIFADPETFVSEARQRVFSDLTDRIVDGVAQTKLASTSP